MKTPELILPPRYQQLNAIPEDPPHCRTYGYETPGALCYVQVYPISAEQAMPYEDPRAVIDGIHGALAEDQGLIEVSSGITRLDRRYLYSVVKSLKQPSGVQYCLTLHLEFPGCNMQVKAFFDEWGTTGVRDAMVYDTDLFPDHPLSEARRFVREVIGLN